MYDRPKFLHAGDQALVVELGDSIEDHTNRKVRDLMVAIEKADVDGVLDLVPSYRSLLVYYDPLVMSDQALVARIEEIEGGLAELSLEKPRIVHIPTLYGGAYGPDLEFVAGHAGATAEEVVSLHSGVDYLVYMMGFSPGFPYLGGMSVRLSTPRLETPRAEIPAGSVGIAENQTGVYPLAGPGGWRLIGRTPLAMFDPERDPPALLRAGDYMRFVPVASENEYLDIKRRADSGEYEVMYDTAS